MKFCTIRTVKRKMGMCATQTESQNASFVPVKMKAPPPVVLSRISGFLYFISSFKILPQLWKIALKIFKMSITSSDFSLQLFFFLFRSDHQSQSEGGCCKSWGATGSIRVESSSPRPRYRKTRPVSRRFWSLEWGIESLHQG